MVIKKDDGTVIGTEYYQELSVGDPDMECDAGIVLSYGVQINDPFKGQGLGQKAHEERLERFRQTGYNYALCIVRRDNSVQMHILMKNGWQRLANTSSRSGVPVYLMGKNLR